MKTIDKKYELTDEVRYRDGTKVFRIRALRDFGDVKAGDLGGFIEKEETLSHDGDAWVGDNAVVKGNVKVRFEAVIKDNACVDGDAWVGDNVIIKDNATVKDTAHVCGNAIIKNNAIVYDGARIKDDAIVCGNAIVDGYAVIGNKALVSSKEDYAVISGFGSQHRTTTFFRLQDGGIGVCCGCFSGTIEEFRTKVHETHDGTKYEKEYLAIADAIEIHFGR